MLQNILSFTGLEGRPAAWQMTFQTPATPIMEGIVDAHGEVITYLIFVIATVCALFYYVLVCFISPQQTDLEIENWQFKSAKTIQVIEFVWTLIPIFLLVIIALPSFSLLFSMEEAINCVVTDLAVTAVGRQWYWVYFYEDVIPLFVDNLVRVAVFESYMVPADEIDTADSLRLLETTDPLIIPAKTFIKMKITADDVIHSWAVPSFGIKTDAVPGRINTTILYVPYVGTYYGQCSELCGVNHAYMPIHINVVSTEDFKTVFFGDIMINNINRVEHTENIPTFENITKQIVSL